MKIVRTTRIRVLGCKREGPNGFNFVKKTTSGLWICFQLEMKAFSPYFYKNWMGTQPWFFVGKEKLDTWTYFKKLFKKRVLGSYRLTFKSCFRVYVSLFFSFSLFNEHLFDPRIWCFEVHSGRDHMLARSLLRNGSVFFLFSSSLVLYQMRTGLASLIARSIRCLL